MIAIAPAPFAAPHSPPGERVRVAGRAVHHQSWGESIPGQPAIWLENGIFGQLLGWGDLPALLQQDGWRVRAYDRGNYGWSSGAGPERSAAAAAREFAELLDALGEHEPILIIAWSGGGLVARCFAAEWPERVAGLILLDAVAPEYEDWAEQAFPQRCPAERAAQLAEIEEIAGRAENGLLREADIAEYSEPQTRAQHGEPYRRLLLESAAHWRTYAAEMAALGRSSEQARRRPLLAHLPLLALIAGSPPLANIADPYERALAAQWRALQEEGNYAPAAATARYVNAGHAIHREAPAAVLAAVRELRAAIAPPARKGAIL